jgi:hypothetical protein
MPWFWTFFCKKKLMRLNASHIHTYRFWWYVHAKYLKEKTEKNCVFGGLEKLNFTFITYKLAKSNLGNLCLQFKSAPFTSMLSPTCKFYMSSKFHKLFASPINKGRPPSRSQVPIAPIPSISFLMAAIASSRERTSDLGSCLVARAGTVPSSSDLGGHSGTLSSGNWSGAMDGS